MKKELWLQLENAEVLQKREGELYDILESEKGGIPVVVYLKKERSIKRLWKAVDDLPENYPEIIRSRYKDNMTLKEIGERLGISSERARQIENNALRKLRIPSRCAPFKCYFEQYLAAGPIYHVGVERFNRTWTSSVEAVVLGW